MASSAILFFALLLAVAPLRAQQPSPQPDSQGDQKAPGTQPAQTQPGTQHHGRVFGIIPNYTTVEIGTHPPPLTSGQKFKVTARTVFDPYEFAIAGFTAGVGQAENSDRSWGQGLQGFGKRYGSAFASQAIGNFMVGAVFPSLLHQDPRYFRLGKGSFSHRFRYSLARLVITRDDSGRNGFNYSELAGNAVAAGVSNFYRAREERTASNTLATFGLQLGVDLLGNELKEFWPDVERRFFHKGN